MHCCAVTPSGVVAPCLLLRREGDRYIVQLKGNDDPNSIFRGGKKAYNSNPWETMSLHPRSNNNAGTYTTTRGHNSNGISGANAKVSANVPRIRPVSGGKSKAAPPSGGTSPRILPATAKRAAALATTSPTSSDHANWNDDSNNNSPRRESTDAEAAAAQLLLLLQQPHQQQQQRRKSEEEEEFGGELNAPRATTSRIGNTNTNTNTNTNRTSNGDDDDDQHHTSNGELAVSPMNLLPYGYHAPSRIFAIPGRHCNHGMVLGLQENTTYAVQTKTPTIKGGCAIAVHNFALGELELAPPLSKPHFPFKVGATVKARRFGVFPHLCDGTIVTANTDITYAVRYASDGLVDYGVLHQDIFLVSEDGSSSSSSSGQEKEKEAAAAAAGGGGGGGGAIVRVRDQVIVAKGGYKAATIVQARLEDDRYLVRFAEPPYPVVEIDGWQVVQVLAQFSDSFTSPSLIHKLFLQLDAEKKGVVLWKDVRDLVQENNTTEAHFLVYDHPISDREIHTVFMQLYVRKKKRLDRSVMSQYGTVRQVGDNEMKLSYGEFEYVMFSLLNKTL